MRDARLLVCAAALAGLLGVGCGGGAAAGAGAGPGAADASSENKKEGYGYEFENDKVAAGKPGSSGPAAPGGESPVKGRLPPEEIQKVVRANFDKLHACYDEALKKTPALAGKLSVGFVINREGAVEGAKMGDGTTITDAPMLDCSLKVFSGLQFPKPEGGIVTVIYPIEFSP